jgi:hypothetical protein
MQALKVPDKIPFENLELWNQTMLLNRSFGSAHQRNQRLVNHYWDNGYNSDF